MVRKGKDRWLHIQQVVHYVKTGKYLPTVEESERCGIRKIAACMFQEGDEIYYCPLLNRKRDHTYEKIESKKLVITSQMEAEQILKKIHEDNRHTGQSATQKLVFEKYYWSQITDDIKELLRNCPKCMHHKRRVLSTMIAKNYGFQMIMEKRTEVTCKAPVNIAVVKYWGKRDESLVLPLNDSFSVTLNSDDLCAVTTIASSPYFTKDCMWLNGVEQDISKNTRLLNCLKMFDRGSLKRKLDEDDPEIKYLHIASENNFPTAAGLASSSAGFACLVYTMAQLFEVNSEISDVARLGSGSACRSVHGGFVHWEAGTQSDGSDSLAYSFQPPSWWPEMRILIVVVNDRQKKVSSTYGMQQSVETSDFLDFRVHNVVPFHIDRIKDAVQERNFDAFARVTIKESNQLHAVCMDSFPPMFYLSGSSQRIIDLFCQYNSFHNKFKVAYTFDAGPNAVIFTLEKDVPEVVALLNTYLPHVERSKNLIKGAPVDNYQLSAELKQAINFDITPNIIQYIIHTKVGEGPQRMDGKYSLLNEEGLPRGVEASSSNSNETSN